MMAIKVFSIPIYELPNEYPLPVFFFDVLTYKLRNPLEKSILWILFELKNKSGDLTASFSRAPVDK